MISFKIYIVSVNQKGE